MTCRQFITKKASSVRICKCGYMLQVEKLKVLYIHVAPIKLQVLTCRSSEEDLSPADFSR